jgi:K+-sensing histidine kinase KdpD
VDIAQRRYRPWLLVASVVVPLAVAALLSLVREQVSTAAGVLVLVLVVVAASSTGVRLAGFLAALSSGVFFDLFLTQPYGTLAVSNQDDVEALVLLLAVGLAVTELALWGRRQQAGASRLLGYLDGVLSTAEKIAAQDPDPADLVALVGTELTGLLRLDGCRYAPVAPHLRTVIQPDGQVRSGERLLDVERHGLPTEEEILLPVRSAGQAVGGFVLTSAAAVRYPKQEQLRVAVLLADQVGTVLARRQGPR